MQEIIMADDIGRFEIERQKAEQDIYNITGPTIFVGGKTGPVGQGIRLPSQTDGSLTNALQPILASFLSQLVSAQPQTIEPPPQFDDLFEIIHEPAGIAAALLDFQPGHGIVPYEVPYVGRRKDKLQNALDISGGKLLVVGRTGEGKTREVTELAITLFQENNWLVCVAKRNGFSYTQQLPDFPNGLRNEKLLLILDDFHSFMIDSQYRQNRPNGTDEASFIEYFEKLIAMIESHLLPRNLRVIATFPSEPHFTKHLKPEVVKTTLANFHKHKLMRLNQKDLCDLLNKLSNRAGIKLGSEDVLNMVHDSDGTPLTIVKNVERAQRNSYRLQWDENWIPVQGQDWAQLFNNACREFSDKNVLAVYHSLYLVNSSALPQRIQYIMSLGTSLAATDITATLMGLENLGLLETVNNLIYPLGVQQLHERLEDAGGGFPKIENHWDTVARAVTLNVETGMEWAQDMLKFSRKLYAAGRYPLIDDITAKVVDRFPGNSDAHFLRGIAFHAQKMSDLALSEYNLTVKLNPSHEAAYYYRGMIHHNNKVYDSAISDYDKAIRLNPNHVEAYLQRSHVQRFQMQLDAAEAGYSKVIELNPNHALAICNRGIVRLLRGEYESAKLDLDRALQLTPDLAPAYGAQGMLHLFMGQFELALEKLDRYGELDLESPERYIFLGIACFMRDDQNGAAKHFKRFYEKYPDDFRSKYMRGVLHYLQGNREAAIEKIQQAIPQISDNLVAGFLKFFLSIIFLEINRIQEAATNYRSSLEYVPHNAIFYLVGGIIKASQEKFKTAMEDLDKALEFNQNFTEAYFFQGMILSYQKEYENAVRKFNRVVQLNPDFVDAYYSRGIIFHEEGKFDLAIADYNQVIQTDPDYMDAYYNRGNAYYNQQEYEAAIADYTRVIELDPEYGDAYYMRGGAYFDQQQYEAAIADYTRAIELDSEYGDAYYMRGGAYFDQQEYGAAIADYTRVIEIDPGFEYAYLERAAAYLSQGKNRLARKDLETSRKIDPENDKIIYNFACLEVIEGNVESGLDYLKQAIQLNSSILDLAKEEPDFEAIRNDPRFRALVSRE
jgi:tetratricopeptide (TPR) repeat protein